MFIPAFDLPKVSKHSNSCSTYLSTQGSYLVDSVPGQSGMEGHRQFTQTPHLGVTGVECIFQTS